MAEFPNALLSVMVFLVLAVASYFDIKTREVPDWVSYGAIVLGILVRGIYSLIQWDYWPILSGVLGLALMVGIGCALFYSRQWGGGDSKILMGLGALLGVTWGIEQPLISFGFNLILIGGIYGLLFVVVIALRHWKKSIPTFKKTVHTIKYMDKFILIVSLGILLTSLFFSDFVVRLFLWIIALILPFTIYLFFFLKSVELTCLQKMVAVGKLTEGDWIVNNVYSPSRQGRSRGKYLCGPKDLGITLEQIALLKKNRIKQVLVKEGIPFLPAFFLAYFVTFFVGNIFLVIVGGI